MNLGIGGRLLLAHLALSVVLIGSIELLLPPLLRGELERQLDRQLEKAATALAAELGEGVEPRVAVQRIARATSFRIGVVGADGSLEADSSVPDPAALRAAGSHADRPEVLQAERRRFGSAARRSATTGLETRYVAVQAPGGRYARAAEDGGAVDASMAAAKRALMGAAAIGLLLAALLGSAASHVAGRTVREINAAARRMVEGDLSDLTVPRGPGELAELSAALERLARQLAAQLGKLTEERDLLDDVLAAMEEAVLVLEPGGTLLHANAAARHLLALPAAAVGQPLIETVRHPALLDAVARADRGEAAGVELVLPGPPRRQLVGRATPLPAHRRAAIVVMLRDVTELRRLEAMRRDFVASASHELRTPVAAIRGYAETLAAGALDDREAAERFVAGLLRQAERLSGLVDGLLDLSRIESGGLRLQPEALDAGEALRRLVDLSRDRAERKRLRLGLDLPAEPLRVRADRRAIEMVVGNLIDNAIKYTPVGGSVQVSARRDPEGAVRIEVADTGPGIPREQQDRIFERFYRVDSGRSREVGGTGLGLAIARHIAVQSGGDIGVQSEVGKGSRFWARFPGA